MQQKKLMLGLMCISTMLVFLFLGDLIFILFNFMSGNNNLFYKLGFSNLYLIPITLFLLIGIIGISKRNYFIYNLILISFGLLTLSSIYNLVMAFDYEYRNLINYIFLLFLSILILWYLIRRKEYFKDSNKVIDFKNPLLKKEEIFFTIAFVSSWLIYFFIIKLN